MKFLLQKTIKSEASVVPVGKYVQGTVELLKYSQGDVVHTEVDELEEVKPGHDLLIRGAAWFDFIKTSQITEIIEATEEHILFKTQTSVYKLSKIG